MSYRWQMTIQTTGYGQILTVVSLATVTLWWLRSDFWFLVSVAVEKLRPVSARTNRDRTFNQMTSFVTFCFAVCNASKVNQITNAAAKTVGLIKQLLALAQVYSDSLVISICVELDELQNLAVCLQVTVHFFIQMIPLVRLNH